MDRFPVSPHNVSTAPAANEIAHIDVSTIDTCKIDGDYAIHNRANGALLILNASAFAIFSAISLGVTEVEIATQINKDTGAQFSLVLNDLEKQLALWRSSGLFHQNPPKAERQVKPVCHLKTGFRSGGHKFTFSSNDEQIFALFCDLLTPLHSGAGPRELSLVTEDNGHSVWFDGQWLFGPGEFPPARHTAIAKIARLAANEKVGCVFHASAFKYEGKTFLVSGRSGAGKSTLTASMAADGGIYIADDLVAMDTPMRALYPNPVRINVKQKSFAVIKELFQDLETAHEWHVAGMKTRYIQPPRLPEFDTCAVNFLLFPKFEPDAKPHIQQLANGDVLSRLTQNGIDLSRTPGAVNKLVEFISRTPCYQLVYSSTAQARALIGELL